MLRLMQLMASANVAHNVIQTPKNLGFELHLPVSFGWFADSMAVIAAKPALCQGRWPQSSKHRVTDARAAA